MKSQHTINERFSTVLFSAMLILTLSFIAAAQEKIAFESNRDGNSEIYVMKIIGN